MMPTVSIVNVILCCSWLWWFVLETNAADFGLDTILQGQQLRDWEVLSSANGTFSLQFFSLGTSNHRYLAIFLGSDYSKEQPLWIANRNNPINDTSGVLAINGTDGMLHITHSGGNIRLPTSSSAGYRNINTSATLLDDGNLVLRQVYPNGSISRTPLWQSFDYPTDVLIPGMKLGSNLKTGHQWLLTSWISNQLVSSGSFTLGVNRSSANQLVMWWHDNIFWTIDFSNHSHTTNSVTQDEYLYVILKYISSEDEKYFTYLQKDDTYTMLRLTPDGKLVVLAHDNMMIDSCNIPAAYFLPGCWNYSSIGGCDLSQTFFQRGCVYYSLPGCTEVDNNLLPMRFSASDGSFLPHSIREHDNNLSIIDCEARCIQNCSCYAYASSSEDGIGCEYWDKTASVKLLSDYLDTTGRLIYVRGKTEAEGRHWWIWFITTVGGTLSLLICISSAQRNCRIKAKQKEAENLLLHEIVDATTPMRQHMMAHEMLKGINEKKTGQVHIFRFETIEIATNEFSAENKLGEGGFGPVYKGKLHDGQEIAVKRLSKSSNQGALEFKNEIELIVKLQHNNLVRLLGCCIHEDEMMLVYEYMPNKSLDYFLFNPSKRELLKWTNRMNIIDGIVQGLLYLHKHSRLRVIHRDLKPNNILLDLNMTPKISDFGMARIFEIQDSEANTKRIVGTHGYMSPEYAIKGIVSTKTDVFSFGVLVLEIVSGKKNHSSYHSERPLNLIGLAWELWIEGRALHLVDTTIDVSNHLNEVQRCINVGLLCVQDSATDRPSMTDVILMLKNESLQLPTPKQPAFFIEIDTVDKEIEESQESNCTNKLSTSIMEARLEAR